MSISWEGVIPAATTQFKADFSIDFDSTATVQDGLIRDGIHGLIVMGTVGENNSLDADEKRALLAATGAGDRRGCRAGHPTRRRLRPRRRDHRR
jgi:dihydrodipicolinate synthase/N-acetylneuraminate lyase